MEAVRVSNVEYCPLCGSEKSLYWFIMHHEFFCKNCNAKWKRTSGFGSWSDSWWTLINPSSNGDGVEYLNEEKPITFWLGEGTKSIFKKKFQEKKILKESHFEEIKELLKNYEKLEKIKTKIQNFKKEGYDVSELEKMIEDIK